MNCLSPVWLALVAAIITLGCSVRPASPIINGVSPNAGPTSGGTSVTITGVNFRAGASVTFGGVGASSVTVGSATQIQAVTPAHSAGSVDVTVRNVDGQSSTIGSSLGFIYTTPPLGPPRVTSISPNSATHGTQVTINGANFAGGATVAFGGATASSTIFVSSSQLRASVPAVGTGVVAVKVTNPGGSSATLPGGFTVVRPQSLLAGMTPSNFTVPAGWALVRTQDFESGSLPPGQYTDAPITTTRPHTGSRSLQSTVSSDANDSRLGIASSGIGSFSEIYLSFYEYVESQARMNVEAYISRIVHPAVPDQAVHVDRYGGDYNDTSAQYTFVGGSNSKPTGVDYALYGPVQPNPFGVWNQWEVWYRPNTPNQSNGFLRLYKNGVLLFEQVNVNLNGGVNMNNGGVDVEAGGVYTRLDFLNADNSCAGFGGGVNFPACNNFNSCRCPAGNPTTPIFSWYIDDIILLKK